MAERTAAAERASDAEIGQFVAEHYDRLVRLARLICRDASDAGDAVQIGLEQAWRARRSLRDGDRVRPWLDRIIVREALRVSRSRRSWLARLLPSGPDVKWIESIAPQAAEPTLHLSMRAAFASLSPEQRSVVALHLHAGYSVAETARIVGAPEETVRSRLRLARQRLRRELEEDRS